MARNIFSEIHLHITWHVKDSSPILRGRIEQHIHRYIHDKIAEASGAIPHAVGGTDDHIHIAVTVPPTLPVAEWIGRIKGASAHYINHRIANRRLLEWQSGYGVVSFGTKDLPWVVAYIQNQRQHHAEGKVYERLESVETEAGSAADGTAGERPEDDPDGGADE
jgi:putative transposase